jgi:hypothetical protein
MTRTDRLMEVVWLGLSLLAFLILIAAGSGTAPLNPVTLFVVSMMLGAGAYASWCLRRAQRYMRHHHIEVIHHVHDGGAIQVVGPHPPTQAQIEAWERFIATIKEPDHE